MFSRFSFSSRTNPPLFVFQGWPVDMTVLFIGAHTLMMIVTALSLSFGHASWINMLSYNSAAVWQGQVTRLITYAFVNPPSIWFVLEMIMLFYFGREVERVLGSKKFALLYASLILIGSGILQLLSLRGTLEQMNGSQSINFAIFTAFVAIYPGLPFLFGFTARWTLVGLTTLSTLQFLEAHQFTALSVFLAESLGALLFMAAQGYQELLPRDFFSFVSKYRKSAAVPATKPVSTGATRASKSAGSSMPNQSLIESCSTTTSFVPVLTQESTPTTPAPQAEAIMIKVDALLEKISQTGMGSLTSQEKEQLEKASTALAERDRSAKPLRTL